jgi:hypothetical protein
MTIHGTFVGTRYVVRRKILKLVGGAFHVWDTEGALAAFSEQKAFKLKEDIRVYSDETKTRELLCIQARQIIDFSACYDVTDTVSGERIGAMRRRGGRSILRDEWEVLGASGNTIGTLIEDSMGMALLRRLLTSLVPQKYDIFFPDMTTGHKVGSIDQAFNPFVYKVDVDFSMDATGQLDRRMGIAAAILLAAIEGRQN